MTAAAPVAAVAAAPAAGGGGAAEAEEEKDEFDVDPHRRRRQEDQRHQGGARAHQPRPEGGQGPGGQRPASPSSRRPPRKTPRRPRPSSRRPAPPSSSSSRPPEGRRGHPPRSLTTVGERLTLSPNAIPRPGRALVSLHGRWVAVDRARPLAWLLSCSPAAPPSVSTRFRRGRVRPSPREPRARGVVLACPLHHPGPVFVREPRRGPRAPRSDRHPARLVRLVPEATAWPTPSGTSARSRTSPRRSSSSWSSIPTTRTCAPRRSSRSRSARRRT